MTFVSIAIGIAILGGFVAVTLAVSGGHGILYSDAQHTAALRVLQGRGVLRLSQYFSTPPEIARERARLAEVEKWVDNTYSGAELAALRSWIRHGYWNCDQATTEFEKRQQIAAIETRMKSAGRASRP
jgi:hypothetical protein